MDNAERPIFLLGTGRCGSTYLQRLLCASDDIWIWGEHDGFLASISRMLKVLDKSRPLDKWHFTQQLQLSDVSNLNNMDATALAWMNPFSRDEFVAAARRLIVDLFGRNLPKGKSRWGFKEIRYGPASRVPELLLEIFPRATIVITARRAFPTIVSAISSWYTNFLKHNNEDLDGKELRAAIKGRAENWLLYFEYFSELISKYPERVLVYRLECPSQLPDLFNAIGIELSAYVRELSSKVLNSSKSARVVKENAALMAIFDEELSVFRERFQKIEERVGYGSNP